MTSQSDLEISGNLFVHPFAELVSELTTAGVTGALQLEDKQRRSIIYFREGRVIFAASNARSARLFQMMLDRRRLAREDVAKVPNFQNDMEFAAWLEDKGFLNKANIEALFAEQAVAIVVDALEWKDGAWNFSSLRRVRDGLEFEVNIHQLLFDYARCLPEDYVLARFRSLAERFHRSEELPPGITLTPNEAFVLSRTGTDPTTITGLLKGSAMSEAKALHVVYTLWLAGRLIRVDRTPALAPETIAMMRGAKLALKQEARLLKLQKPEEEMPSPPPVAEEPKPTEAVVSLNEYLDRVENAETYYDILGIDSKSDIPTIKRAYFALAKAFHPDKFHSEGPEMARRVQNAFTEMMQAHETLKSNESRDLYDYRMRKELIARERRIADTTGNTTVQTEQASDQFQQGFTLLMDGDVEAALPYLARAAHYAPKVARYHMYYGKALSADPDQRHKAESELQAGLKLDPTNPSYRIMLVEFFIEFNLMKRAEGELKRLLAVFPSNREARALLDKIKAQA